MSTFIDINMPVGFKSGFQSNLDFNDSKYCFKYEYGKNGKRCLIIGDDKNVFMDWFKSLPEEKKKFYELIRETDIVAEYYDIDFHITEDMKLTEDDVDDKSIEIIRILLDTRNQLSKQKLSNKDLIVLSAHTPTKLSLHIISKKTFFKTNKLQQLFCNDVYKKLEEFDFNVDTSVYSKNRCFRMYLNHKYGKDNTLVLFNPSIYSYASFEDTWVVLTHKDLSQRVEITNYTEDDLTIATYHDDEEEMTDDLLPFLQKFIDEHPYLRAEVDQYKSVNRINRVDHTTRACLTDPSDSHSMENMYWYIKRNALYVGCFCNKGAHICLGRRQGIKQIEMEADSFKYGTHSSNDFHEYEDLIASTGKNIKTIYDKRRTGGGKTTCAMNYAKKFEKVLLVHHRLSLDSDYITKYPEFTSYQDGTNNNDKQTVCFNSLSKMNPGNYDLIIIDEIRSILKQTEMKDMVYSTHTLFNILEDMSTPLVMLDANMTNADIEFLSKHRADRDRICVHNTEVSTDKNVYIVEESREELLSKIEKDIEHRKKVVIVYNISIEKMNALLTPYKENYQILHINKLTRKDVDMDTSLWFDAYDIIAYSPTISEGVSINDPRFRNINAYGVFTSTSCPAESVSQMIARFRAIENFTIHIDTTRVKAGVPIFHDRRGVLHYVNNNLQSLKGISKSHCNVRRENSELTIIEDEFCELFCKNMLEKSQDYHNYRSTMIQKLINNGYNVFEDLNQHLTTEESVSISETVKQLQADERDRMNNCILTAQNISFDEYKSIEDVGISCEEDECKVQKYNIVHTVNIQNEYLTEGIVGAYRDSSNRSIIRNIKRCFGFIRNEHGDIERISTRVLIQENVSNLLTNFDKKSSFLDQRDVITHYSTSKMHWLNSRVSELGFDYLLSPEGIPMDEFLYNMNRIVDYYSDPENYTEYANSELLFGKYYSKQKQGELCDKFIKDKLFSMFKLKFGIDKEKGIVYQQIVMGIRLYDPTRMYPNLLGGILLTEDIVHQYDIMFMYGMYGKYCAVCDKQMKNYIGFTHINSKTHQANLLKN